MLEENLNGASHEALNPEEGVVQNNLTAENHEVSVNSETNPELELLQLADLALLPPGRIARARHDLHFEASSQSRKARIDDVQGLIDLAMKDETGLMGPIALRFEEGPDGSVAIEQPRRVAAA